MNDLTRPGWRLLPLSAVAECVTNSCVPGHSDHRPYVALEHIAAGTPQLLGHATAREAASTKLEFEEGDVLFGKLRPNLRKSVRAPFSGVCSTDILVLRTTREADSRFLLHITHSSAFQQFAISTASGTKMPRTSWSALRSFRLSVPPLPEQRKIAAILSSVDDAIEATQRVIDQLAVVKQAMMEELLTRGIPGRHKRFEKTEIGLLPDRWRWAQVGALCKRVVVGIVVRPASYYVSEGVPCLRSKNVRADTLDLTDLVYISRQSNDLLAKSRLRQGDVVIVRTGNPGTSCVVPPELEGANCIDLIVATPGSSIRGAFLSRVLNSRIGRAAVAQRQGGLAQQHCNVGGMRTIVVPVPPLDEQDEIVSALRATDDRISVETANRSSAWELKEGLLAGLLSGDIRVRSSEAAS